jgi:hypothetical protein
VNLCCVPENGVSAESEQPICSSLEKKITSFPSESLSPNPTAFLLTVAQICCCFHSCCCAESGSFLSYLDQTQPLRGAIRHHEAKYLLQRTPDMDATNASIFMMSCWRSPQRTREINAGTKISFQVGVGEMKGSWHVQSLGYQSQVKQCKP